MTITTWSSRLNNGCFDRWPHTLGHALFAFALVLATVRAGSPLQWDNTEYFAPVIRQIHAHILRGQMPWFTFNQHLGEPFSVNVQAGHFYFVYTISEWLTQRAGGAEKDEFFLRTVLAFSLLSGYAAYWRIGGHFGVDPLLRHALVLGSVFGGYISVYSNVWLPVAAVGAWLPWMTLGCLQLQDHRISPLRPVALIALAAGLLATTGHPQFWGYSIIFVATLGLLFNLRSVNRLTWLSVAVAAGAILSLPVVLPAYLFKALTVRQSRVPLHEFLGVSADWSSFAGLVSPLVPWNTSFLSEQPYYLLTYLGPLAFLCLLVGLARGFPLVRSATPDVLAASNIRKLVACIALFWLFALGEKTPVYSWTYGIPVWGTLRWPSKFLMLVQVGLSVLILQAAASLDSPIRLVGRIDLVRASAALLALAHVALWLLVLRRGGPHVLPAAVLTAGALMCLTALFIGTERPARLGLLAGAVVSSLGFTALVTDLELKRYTEGYSVKPFDFEPYFRVLPLTEETEVYPFRLGRLSLASAATQQGYWSATGVTHDMVPRMYRELVPSGIFGAVPRQWFAEHRDDALLDFLGVRYLSTHVDEDRALLSANPKYQLRRPPEVLSNGVRDVSIYENLNALPVAFLASRSKPVMNWRGSAREVHIAAGDQRMFAGGQIESIKTTGRGEIHVEGHSDGNNLLVFSLLNLPGWKAKAPYAVVPVNERFMAVALPPGPFAVTLSYFPPGLKSALVIVLAALLLSAVALGSACAVPVPWRERLRGVLSR